MWKNYFKIALRNLRRQGIYTFLNMVGLSIGLAGCLLVSHYVLHELSYDTFFENAERIYRVDSQIKFGDKEMEQASVAGPLTPILRSTYAQVEAVARVLSPKGSYAIRSIDREETQMEEHVAFVDSTFFSVFSFRVIEGDVSKALTQPFSVVLTAHSAKKYFGSESALNKSLLIDNETVYTVTAVVEELPEQTHLRSLNVFFSLISHPDRHNDDWANQQYPTYLRLREGVAASAFQEELDRIVLQYAYPALAKEFEVTVEQLGSSGNYMYYSLLPLKDIHLYSDKDGEIGVNGNIAYVYIFSIVAVFLLVIACVNFVNLSTARANSRYKEVMVRRAVGADRARLIFQFLVEVGIITFVSIVLAVTFAIVALPWFNHLGGRNISLLYDTPQFWLLLVLTGSVVTLLAGGYPAMFLSGLGTSPTLPQQKAFAGSSSSTRNALVVFQFTLSIMLITCTVVIHGQLDFIQNQSLGYNKEQVLILNGAHALGNQIDTFKEELTRLPEVERVSVTGYLPTPSERRFDIFLPEGSTVAGQGVNMNSWWVDVDYIATLGLELLEGRGFSADYPTDSAGLILNQAAARLLGYDNPVGKEIYGYVDSFNEKESFTILGIIRDFHFESLRQNIRPLALTLRPHAGAVSIRFNTNSTQRTLQQIETLWSKMAPDQAMSYRFMDEDFDNLYRSEQRMGRVFVTFALLSILIACLGLFGLAAFTSERRTKEIGVRKVLGASIAHIISMLSADLLKLVVVAILIASPLAWYAMNRWLADFAYRIEMEWWMFALAGLGAVAVALLTVSFQAIKAAVANPVESLKAE